MRLNACSTENTGPNEAVPNYSQLCHADQSQRPADHGVSSDPIG